MIREWSLIFSETHESFRDKRADAIKAVIGRILWMALLWSYKGFDTPEPHVRFGPPFVLLKKNGS